MGNIWSNELVDAEKTSWVRPHSLDYDPNLRRELLPEVEKFGAELSICFADRTICGYKYQHWWITDGTRTLEFGGGQVLDNTVNIICKHETPCTIFRRFTMTDQVKERMRDVVGATNYSLALRNCEHVARYVYCGSWLCSQMVGDGVLRGYFFDYMSTFTKRINILPEELKKPEQEKTAIYGDALKTWVTFERSRDELTAADQRAFNIVFLGPTGSGKSTIGNTLLPIFESDFLFNFTVVQSFPFTRPPSLCFCVKFR